MEGECYLKTRHDNFKKYWAVIMGNEIYFYRRKDDPQHRVMHCLVGTFTKELPEEKDPSKDAQLYPLKIILPPHKSRLMFFA